ncbi:molybdenum import ATP-binding protein ModC [Sulfuriferula plumbiphila]|uniref:Molybdenum import ATP-binding protein ModC n=1 Tax=Sulfuriferula plumbiphila TaxID=171865 RepID=A0A512LB43_9PROT|nr:TOBE domain-containing protein [Sulfuriferula plumbiphila]BBP04302.1 molybdenum import ATP-binding protein ModC [Sulfuriferula plumbiphila]GEP31686.1 molybdenum import ATP-binding protein ModC [Sulfuriferula plumbiphila]
MTALFGHSGSGKTTLLRCVAGLERAPDSFLSILGEVWRDDAQGIFLLTHERPLGYVFQEAGLFPHLSIQRNLEYGQKRVAAAQRRVSLDQAVALLGSGWPLPGRWSPVHEFSAHGRTPGGARPQAQGRDIALPGAAARRAGYPGALCQLLPGRSRPLGRHLVLMENGQVRASGPLTETLVRLDLPIRLDEDAGVVLEGSVSGFDAGWHLVRVSFAGGKLWVRDSGVPLNHRLCIRILARDVGLALEPHTGTSILNVLPAVVTQLGDDIHPALTLVRLDAGGAPLLARFTRRSAAVLDLHPGQAVWAQIKAVALIG